VKLDNEHTTCRSAEIEAVQRPHTAEASGLPGPADDDDVPHDLIERDGDDNDIAQVVS